MFTEKAKIRKLKEEIKELEEAVRYQEDLIEGQQELLNTITEASEEFTDYLAKKYRFSKHVKEQRSYSK